MIDATIIIPAYNQESTLAQAIESIIRQQLDGHSFEIILIDDGSKDLTPAICRDYSVRYPHIIRYIPHTNNRGIVRTYREALKLARGRYIADCAGDDEWSDSRRLHRHISFLDRHPEINLIHSSWIERDSSGLLRKKSPGSHGPGIDGSEMIPALLAHESSTPVIHLSTVLWRADVTRRVLDSPIVLNPRFRCEDTSLLCYILSKSLIAYDPNPGLFYTVGSGTSITSDSSRIRSARFTLATIYMTLRLSFHYRVPFRTVRSYLLRRTLHLLRTLLGVLRPRSFHQ